MASGSAHQKSPVVGQVGNERITLSKKSNSDSAPARTMSINEYIAGAVAGSAGIIVGHPFDTTKIQMQMRTTGQHRIGTIKEAWTTVWAQGLQRGLFRGMAFPVVSYAFINSVFFGVYGNVIHIMEPDLSIKPTETQVYLAGCFAGTVQLVLACPVEVIKCTMQSQIPLTRKISDGDVITKLTKPVRMQVYYKSPLSCIAAIYNQEGTRGFYRGLTAMFIRDVPSYGLYLLVYDIMYTFLFTRGWTDQRGIFAAIIAGGLAGSASWGCIMPFDVIKSRLQIDHGNRYTGFVDCAVKSVQNAGPSVLFRGTTLTMIRAFPVNAITFLFYSQLLQQLQRINPRSVREVEHNDL